MPKDQNLDLGSLVEPDRVHKACYADEEIFEQELKNIFHKSWIYNSRGTKTRRRQAFLAVGTMSYESYDAVCCWKLTVGFFKNSPLPMDR